MDLQASAVVLMKDETDEENGHSLAKVNQRREGGTMAPLYTILTAGLALSLSTTTLATAQEPRARPNFKQLYAQRSAAAQALDVDAFIGQTAPDYIVKLSDGRSMSREQLEKRLRSYFGSKQLVKQVSYAYVIKDIQLRGDNATVVVEQQDKRIQIRSDGKPHEIEAHVIHTDLWLWTGTEWKLKETREGQQTKFAVDGKEVTPGG